jgi:hypothetical protein
MNNYDKTEIQVITLIDDNQKFHGTVVPPPNTSIDQAKQMVLEYIKQVKANDGWTWKDVHQLLSDNGFFRVGQTYVFEHEIHKNWAVMALKSGPTCDYRKPKLYAVVATSEEAVVICDDLRQQGWEIVYKQETNLVVNHVAQGSLYMENKNEIYENFCCHCYWN